MSDTYTGVSSNITEGQVLSITEAVDGDAVNGTSVQQSVRKLADASEQLYEMLQAMLVVNLFDNGAVNSITSVNDIVWASSLGLWVAVGAAGTISTSPDAVTWTARTSNVTSSLSTIGWNGTMLVAAGKYTGNAAPDITTSTDGVTWTAQTSNGTVKTFINQVVWDATLALWCAVASSDVGTGGYVLTSPDGVTWTKTAVGSATDLYGVAANGSGRFLVVGTDATHNAWTSTNGTTWTAQTISGLTATGRAVAYSSLLSAFLVLDTTSTAKSALSTSNTGTSWNTAISTTIASVSGFIGPTMKWTGRAFVANISSAKKTIQYSLTGASWKGHIPSVFGGGSIKPLGFGVNSDTAKLLVGADNGHAYASLAQPFV